MIRRPESKLWQLIKKNTPDILWNRIEATPLEQTTLNIYGGIQARDMALNVQESSLNVQEPLITFHKPFDWKGVTNFLTQEGGTGGH
jgi:hypothetical protein